jgi:hypothetical protein
MKAPLRRALPIFSLLALRPTQNSHGYRLIHGVQAAFAQMVDIVTWKPACVRVELATREAFVRIVQVVSLGVTATCAQEER